MNEYTRIPRGIVIALMCVMFATGCFYDHKAEEKAAAKARSVESFPDHSEIPNTNPKSKLQ